ncbi:MAG: type II toxin-antitoxin system VapC family toxin [Candidatus Diapherotrites archaeon]|nr:type II toxin-antitoxin system VapC family toxin [Candidatus Diapherotrites archaeon]
MIVDTSGFVGAYRAGKLERLVGSTTTTLIYYELGNLLRTDVQLIRKLSCKDSLKLMLLWSRFIDEFMRTEVPVWSETLKLAIEKKITFYDAAYLWLARRLKEPLITMDKKLARLTRSVHPNTL